MKLVTLLGVLVYAVFILAPVSAPAQAARTNIIFQQTSTSIARDTSPVAVPQPSEKAMRFYRSGNVLWGIRQFWQLLIPALFLFTGLSARIRTWAQRWGRTWYFTFALYFSVFTLLSSLVSLPLDYYTGYVRLHDYNLSNQTFNKWIGDSLKYLAIFLIGGLATWWLPLLLIQKSPRRWWFYTGLLVVPCLCVQMLIWPVCIDPLFNKFQPLQDKAIEARRSSRSPDGRGSMAAGFMR